MPIERIYFWGISAVWLFYGLAGISVAVFFAGAYFHVSVWMAARRGGESGGPAGLEGVGAAGGTRAGAARGAWPTAGRRALAGLGRVVLDGLLGRRILKGDVIAGLMHGLIMWGFAGLFIGTVLSTIDHWFVHFLAGRTYQVFSLCLDIFGVMLIAGLLVALFRRYVEKVPRLENRAEDLWILIWLAAAVVTGFAVEGTRLAVELPGWESYSFGGVVFSRLFSSERWAETVYPYVWWFHALICLGLIAYFPFSKLFHSLAAPVNIYLAPRPVPARLGEDGAAAEASPGGGAPATGTAGGPRFSFRDLVEFSACTRCGRCDTVCPSASADEPFSPRTFIVQARAYTKAAHNPLSRVRWFREKLFRSLSTVPEISPAQIWFCTTCRACLEVCPVYVGAFEPIRQVRKAEIEEGSRVSPLLTDALERLYMFDNPWEPSKKKRKEWPGSLTVPDLTEGATAELCYWVGCTTSYDTRAQKPARAFVRILNEAGVGFGTLGQKEVCCGDIARRVGEQGLFEDQVEKTMGLFAKYGITDLVTSSPHCFNLIKNEYPSRAPVGPVPAGRVLTGAAPPAVAPVPAAPPAGAEPRPLFRVRHYAQLLEELLDKGALRPHVPVTATVTFHDPCYLGRYNQVYEAPRRVIRSIPGVSLVEMPHHGPDSLCCGGGGGRMWQELEGEKKLSEVRIREAAATGADIVVTACPYCLIMLEDAVKTADLDLSLRVMDLNELLAHSLGLAEDEG
ncbi:MAG: respiratory nitrate reductase subunit gamma [Actinomycetia bacterium]|nr:respiratory nitrate reductase subunit gamma [Actinomycetes bacterium]